MSIKRSLAISSGWTVAASVFDNLSMFVIFLVLARMLTPEQFGIVAFATIFVEIGRTVVNAGIADALVQRGEWDGALASTAFWTNLGFGVALCGTLAFVAAPLAGTYYDPTFGWVLAALSLDLLIEGSTAVHVAKLRREFKYKAIATRGMSARLLSGAIGIALAYAGAGVWALVVSKLIASSATSVILWRAADFRPRFTFALDHVRSFRRFASHQLASQLIGQGNAQVGGLVIGWFLGPAAIAQYRVGSRALSMIVGLVITPLQSTAMSAFSRVQDRENGIASAYLRITRACALLACPMFFGLAAVAPDFMTVVFGAKWRLSSAILVALALVVGPATLNYFQGPALSSAGRSGLNFWATLVGFLGNLVAALIAVPFGVVAVAASYTIRAHLTTPLSLRFVTRGIGVSPWAAIANIAPAYLCAALMCVILTLARLELLRDWAALPRLAVCVAAGPVLYLGAMWLFARGTLRANLSEIAPLVPAQVRRYLPT